MLHCNGRFMADNHEDKGEYLLIDTILYMGLV